MNSKLPKAINICKNSSIKLATMPPAIFETAGYLGAGNQRQQQAHKVLEELGLMKKLQDFTPVLTGTIPIEIDIATSDLDIICCCADPEVFSWVVSQHFGNEKGFSIAKKTKRGIKTVVAGFVSGGFAIEIFGQPAPVWQQNAWRHLLIEHAILKKHGEEFRQQIISLKKQGIKTEPAFAQLLGLSGDPYLALLHYGANFR